MELINAPWPRDVVDALNAHQKNPYIHPYTCGNDSRHRELVATVDGWRCPDCDYRQGWAHEPRVEAENEGAK